MAGDLRAALGTDDVSVRAAAGPLGAVQGRLARLRVRARHARFDGSAVDEFLLDLRGVRVDAGAALRGTLVVRGVDGGTAVLVVGEDALRRYLQSRGVREPSVELADGAARITGRVTVLDALVEVAVRAGFVLRDGTRLDLDVRELRVGGLEVPRELGNALAASVNPILTAPTEPVRLRFTGVGVDRGMARLAGEVVP